MNFDMKNITTYLGCAVLVLFAIYMLTNMLSLNTKVVEGLLSNKAATPEELLKDVKTDVQQNSDALHIAKYKSTYQEILVSVEDLLHLQMLSKLKKIIQDGKLTDQASMETMCKLQGCKGALKDLDEFLDAFKPPTSS